MPKGRKTGEIRIELDQIVMIINMTLDRRYSRRQIAEEVEVSKNTVYRYQKHFDLL